VIQNGEPLARNEGEATIRWFCEQKGFKLVTKVSKTTYSIELACC